MESKLILVIILLGLAMTTQCKRGKKGDGQKGLGILRFLSTCGGQSLNVSSQREATKECLKSRIQEIQDKMASSNENANKKGKKKGKKKGIAKMLRKKCRADCQWNSFGLIPDANNGTEYDTSSLDFTSFLNLFPESAQETLQSEMLACYNTSSIEPLKEGKKMNKGMAKQMCTRNKKLLRCLKRTVKSTCRSMEKSNGMTTPKPQVSSTTRSNGEYSTSANRNSTSVAPANSTPKAPSTDMANDDTDGSNGQEEDDDDEEDDGSEDEDVQVTTTPSASFNTSRPISE